MPYVHWMGRAVPAEEAKVSVLDTGFLYGDGIYETMRAYSGRVFAVGRHLGRLRRSAAGIGLELPATDTLRRALEETLRANDARDAVVRLTITRGALTKRLDLSTAGEPSVLVTADPVDPAQDERRREGVRVVYSKYLRLSGDPLAGIKSTNYQVSLFARNEAREAGAAEVLVPNESGDIVEAAAANVFLVDGGAVVTPPLRAGILGGVTREIVLELAAARALPAREETLPRERIESADELFLSGTTIRVTPVTSVGDRAVADGAPGPVTRALLHDYLAAVRTDTEPGAA